MCGISGAAAFYNNPVISLDKLRTMVDTLYHRGPDKLGTAIHNNVAMGMRRLSIIDLAGGSQPIYNEDKSVWTVFNGEIYNFQELRSILRSKGHKFLTNTDTEVLTHGYEEWGNNLPKYLNGMFAIALHDIKRNKFLLIRDHIGIKPLYYFYNKDMIIFGSEIKSLIASGIIPQELNLNALGEFLSWEYVPGPSTLFKSIKKLKPGCIMEIDLHNPKFEQKGYWDIPFTDDSDKNFTAAEWEEIVLAQIKKSTQMQLISDVPLGAFLSGGVDSSLIVASMGGAKTFSIGFDDPSYNELKWARKVANHLKVNHQEEIIKPDVVELFEHLMQYMDDPIGDFSIFPTYLVSKLARKHVTVSLSGDGGDELFGGYETYLADNKARKYNTIPHFFRKGLIESSLKILKPTAKKKGLINKAKRFVEGFEHPIELSHARWRLFAGVAVRNQLFTKDSLDKIDIFPGSHILNLFNLAGDRGELNRSLYVDVKSYLCDNILTKVDRMSMAVSLETRVPFLDTDLVELAFRIPEELKVKNNDTKILLKKVASRFVPKECIYRPKEGFSIPMKHWLNNEFRPLLEDLLNPKKLKEDGIFNPIFVESLKREHYAGLANHSHLLWSLIVFHDWQNRWLKNKQKSFMVNNASY